MRSCFALAVVFALFGLTTCQHRPPNDNVQSGLICDKISLPSTPGPASGTFTKGICVAPLDCREDTMAKIISKQFCSDKGGCNAGHCEATNARCKSKVNNSGLQVTSCTWDRDDEQGACENQGMHHCTCSWQIPAGSSLECGCECQVQ